MSLKPGTIPPLPDETRRVAHAIFPQDAPLLRLHDALGSLYDDALFADLFPTHGHPAEAPWRLALVTVFQFMEDLSDRQAAHAVRTRIDWKYALRLELTDPGFDFTVLSEFRARLLAGHAEQRLLIRLLEVAKAQGWVPARVDSAPMRRMCWRRSAPSTGSNWWARPCVMRSMCWRKSRQSGCAPGSHRSRTTAPAN